MIKVELTICEQTLYEDAKEPIRAKQQIDASINIEGGTNETNNEYHKYLIFNFGNAIPKNKERKLKCQL